jgi:hypothetical protein
LLRPISQGACRKFHTGVAMMSQARCEGVRHRVHRRVC